MANAASGPNLTRASKFGAVGILNTALDFTLFNLGVGIFGFSIIIANIISTTIAMVFSFFANRHVVFKARDGSASRQALLFLVVTAFGLYVLQLGVLKLFTAVWLAPLGVVVNIVHAIGLRGLSDKFIRSNSAKLLGTVVSLIWNYLAYKWVVFKT